MPYSDFTYETVQSRLGLKIRAEALFASLASVPAPRWLKEALAESQSVMPLSTEKSRSEAIVALVLMAAAKLTTPSLTVYSGQRLDVEAPKGLNGECDFILARTSPVPSVHAPIFTVVGAKNADILLGLGQCIAQMEGARILNEREGLCRTIFGCVTTGELWQFLRHDDHRGPGYQTLHPRTARTPARRVPPHPELRSNHAVQ